MLEGKVNSDICIQPNQKLNGVIMPYIVTKPDKTVPITIRNLTDKNISLRKGTNLGTAAEIDEVLENHNPGQNSIKVQQISKQDRNHSEKTEDVCQNMPENLKDIFERSKDNLNEKECIQKRELTIHHDQLKPCSDRNIPKWLKYMRHRLLQGEVDYSLGIGQSEEENIHDLSQLLREDNDREPDHFVHQEIEDGINKDHAGSTGFESFQQLKDLESFLNNTGEIEEIGVEQHSTGLGNSHSSDVNSDDRHIVTNLDGVNMILNNKNTDDLDDTFLYAIDNYGGRIRNRPKYPDDYNLSDMF
ncbi:unnamed protein product [Mytilus coruscus]|uniref:Uncharacterized protein n=1 Tax=Mytilus coruscus TaxID=42192 RepID=A0A6J8BXM0_MYTCO|nr:unnamed protein product [Mytilus coruscus]